LCLEGWAHTLKTCDRFRRKNPTSLAESAANAVVDDAAADEVNEHALSEDGEKMLRSIPRPQNLSYEEMAQIGWKIKRIFDFGRVEYMKNTYCFNAKQLQYCTTDLSPENVLLVATRK